MKFFENKVELKVTTVFDFLRTAANLLLFGPFRLVQEISKKIVYVTKIELNRVFFTAVIIALLMTVANTVAQLATGNFDIFKGKMPLILMLACSIVLLIVYCIVSSKRFTFMDVKFTDVGAESVKAKKVAEPKDEEVITTDVARAQKSAEQKLVEAVEVEAKEPVVPVIEPSVMQTAVDLEVEASDSSGDSSLALDTDFLLEEPDLSGLDLTISDLALDADAWLKENDTFTAKENADVLHNVDVQAYQKRLETGIAELENIGDSYAKFSDAEVQLLQNKLNAITTSDRFLSKDFIANFNNNLVIDEECILQHGTDEVDDNFTLCAG